ncbi:MAG: murein biosynthesis integral membrane protein MurJ [Sedimentisphaerales bacterium]|nr:murein biosynthesis integral membrane protein MurJ [Sedimentisphaerales bacterium]HNY79593.1 murein biosynthesis integral membrane protein MurJ [Sedimentisphaerales bacterium]HOC65454.1 murein biosynthesis integral membrane protein MurJ [Sedimentisphaerales bacterium]HOH65564.1 murein biosynthesis integral membrane protein MurJ [Sedimentisphaerales bacterium]HQA90133.1 murein biosynthesis integral membrane protein MurJ [Sedimentisphaerales bacterium]
MIKGFRQIVVLTVVSRVLGMIRDMVFAFFLGASGVMDGWVIAFMIPNLSRRLFGEGAASSSLIPVYSRELARDRRAADRLAMTAATVVFVLLAVIVIAGEALVWILYALSDHEATRLKLVLTGAMLPYMILVCTVAILGGILNTHRHFAAPAAAPVVLNVLLIVALCFGGWALKVPARTQVFLAAGAVLLTGFVQLVMHIPPLHSCGVHLRPAWDIRSDAFRRVLLLMGPMILGLAATQINTLADSFIALWLSGSPEKGHFFMLLGWRIDYPLWEGAVSQLFYAQRLYQFPLGVFGISLATAIFPVLSADAARNDLVSLRNTVSRGLRCSLFISIPATVGLVLISEPTVSLLFERGEFSSADSVGTTFALAFYVLGLSGYFAQQVLTRVFYALQESGVPARSAAVAVLVNVCLNLTLVWFLGCGGLAASTAICSYIQVGILMTVLRHRLGPGFLHGMGRAILQTIGATICMEVVLLAVMYALRYHGIALQLSLAVPAAAVAYLLISWLLHIEMLGLLLGGRRTTAVVARP